MYSKGKITLAPVKVEQKDFLRAFYLNDNEVVFLRAIDDKKKRSAIPYKVELWNYKSIFHELKKQNELDMCISFSVNGGGRNNKEVIASGKCQAQFMEMDDYSLEVQLAIINAFELRPSIVVKTRKSLHAYWLLEDGDINNFRNVQNKFIEVFGSDPNIKDESRVMRLPGFYHCKKDPVMVEVISFQPDLRYKQEQIEEALKKTSFKDLLERSDLNAETREAALKTFDETDKKPAKAIYNIVHDPEKIQEGGRVNALVSIVSKLKFSGIDNSAIKGAIISMNNEQCNPPLSQEELEQEVFPTLQRWETQENTINDIVDTDILEKFRLLHPESNNQFKWNDKGDGALFAEVCKNFVRWNVTAKEWFCYDGKIWKIDKGGMIAQKYSKKFFDAIMVYSLEIKDESIREGYLKHVSRLGQYRNRKTMLEDAKDRYFISSEMLDKDDFLLNLQNGVYDLKNFILMKHEPDMLLSKICNVSYDESASGEKWIKFLEEVMLKDKSKIDYLQKILGYSMTGDTKEETCYILFGQTTRNGKSTLVETISYMLGESKGYAMNMRPESLAIKRNNDSGRASSDIARLDGCRFVNAAEPPKRMLFDVGLLKTMLGRDSITARYLHENEFQFTPRFKLFINTNFLPLVTDDTLFSSGRINVISFDRHFSEDEQNKSLKDELREESTLSGILNWCIEGLRKYNQEGAAAPESVKKATDNYRKTSDKIGNFMDECLEYSRYHTMAASEVYSMFQDWCAANGYGLENKGNFYAELRSRNLMAESGTVNGRTLRNVVPHYKPISDPDGYFIPANEGKSLPFE